MAASKEVGDLKAKVRLETLEFNEDIKKLSGAFSKVEREFKLASVGLDKVSDASKIAALQIDKLTKQTEIQKKIVEQFRQAHQKAAEQFGSSSKRAQDYELSLKKAEEKLASLDKQLKTATDSLNKHGLSASEAAKKLKDLGVTWESVGKKFTDIGRVMTAAITAPIIAAGVMGMKFNAQMEDFQANFETMLGSAEAAQTMIADLTAFAKSTPFEMTGLADSAKILLNFGVDARDVMKDLKMLGDVSLGNQEKLGRLTLAFGQIQSTGRLMGQDLHQLINAGFNPLQVISEKTGRSMADLKEDMEKGAISADMVTEAFQIATSEGGMFFGAMEKGSRTLNGQMSTLKDTINITLGETMKPLFDDLSKNILPKIIASVEKIGKYFASLSDQQKENILKWVAIAAAAGPVLLIVGKLITLIPALITGVQALGVAFSFLAGNPIILGIMALAAGILLISNLAGSANREIQAMTDSLIDGYRRAAEAEKEAIDASHAARIEFLNGQIDAENAASKVRITAIQKEYDAEIATINKKEQALKKSLQERSRILDDDHKKRIDAIRDEYGVFEEKQKSKTDVVREEAESQKSIVKEVLDLSKDLASQEGKAYESTYNAILEKARDIHDEKLRMYQEEYLKSVALINQDLAQKVGGFQAEIDELNKKTEEEDRIAQEQADAQKIADLQAKVDTAKSYSEYTQATKELATEINRQNREKELKNRQIQIDSLNDQIRVATEKASEEKQKALKVLQTKTGEQQTVIDAATAHEIAKIQEARIAKETAENKKYDAAKAALDREEAALDGWGERYKAALDKQLAYKQAAEAAKVKAATDGLIAQEQAEKDAVAAEKKAVDQKLAAQTAQAKIAGLQAQLDSYWNKIYNPWQPAVSLGIMPAKTDRAALEKQIADIKAQAHAAGLPGFASGVRNWQGGLARVNENGGEIRYLERGTTVIPNDVSMQIANSVGAALGRGGSLDSRMLAENNALMRQLIGLVQESQRQPIMIDGRSFGEAALPGLLGVAKRQNTAWPVRSTV